MKIVCLISTQLVPNYQLVKHLTTQNEGAHQVLCIFTEATRKETGYFADTIARHLTNVSVRRDDGLYVDRADHVQPTERIVTELVRELPNESWVVNCVGGTKMMAGGAILASRDARAQGVDCRALYVDIDQPGLFVDAFSGEREPMLVDLSVQEYLDLFGIPVPPPFPWMDGERRWEPFCVAWCEWDPRVLPMALSDDQNEREQQLKKWRSEGHPEAATLPWNPNLSVTLTEQAKALLPDGAVRNWEMRLLTGDLLDNFIYAALSRYADQLEVDEVRRSVRSKPVGEVDLYVVRRSELLLIECKAGRHARAQVMKQIADVDFRRQRIGAKKSRSMLISSGETLFVKAADREWEREVITAVNRGSIQVIGRPHIRRLASAMRQGQHEDAITMLRDWLDGDRPAPIPA